MFSFFHDCYIKKKFLEDIVNWLELLIYTTRFWISFLFHFFFAIWDWITLRLDKYCALCGNGSVETMPLLKVLATVGACLSPVMNLWKRNDGSLLWRPLSSADTVIHGDRICSSLERIVTDLGLDQQNKLSTSNYSFLAAQRSRNLESGRDGKSNFIDSPRCLKCVFYFLPPSEERWAILILQERKWLQRVSNLPKVISWNTK